MTEANVIFILDGAKLAIQCTPIDKMKDICQKYSSKIKKDMNSLLFSYKGNQLNLESNFKDQVNLKDKNTDEMIILVNKRDDNVYSNRKNLIENIKSIYFIKILFSHMNEKNKLKLLKYNKNLQETMDFKLINYKFYSGRYIIYDTNGKGREYSGEDDKLIFEGEYLNGKKNGKGKEYYSNGGLFYEGEYLNGKINGKGKEYNYEGKLIFEGEYLNGKRWNGKGKKYLNGKIEFDTEYLNGINLTNKVYDKNGKLYEISKNMKGLTLCAHMRRSREMLFHILMKGPLQKASSGLIKEYDHKGNLIFEGEYFNGNRNGKGKSYYANGKLYFEGEYLNGERNGKGKKYNEYGRLKFEGEYLNGKKNGKGKEYNEDGKLIFKGEYLNGKKYKGIEYEYNEDNGKLIFEYEYLNGEKNGTIKEYDKYEGHLLFSGNYLNGKKNGEGIEYRYGPNKSNTIKIFSGIYLNGERKKGKEYNYEGNLVYEGEYLNGKRNGKGRIYYGNNLPTLKYEGEFSNGKKHGKGIEYDIDKHLKYEGEFLNGKKHGKGKEYIYKFTFTLYGKYIEQNYLLFEGEYFNDYKVKGKEYYANGKLKFEGEYLFNKKLKGKIYDCNGNIIFKLDNGNAKIEEKENYKCIKILYNSNSTEESCEERIKGKEYDYNGRLLFEGEYHYNREWKGNFYNYFYDELIFEGDYLNGEIWSGKGKEYNQKGIMVFDGEYINGKKKGKGERYDYKNRRKYDVIFDGENFNDNNDNDNYIDN